LLTHCERTRASSANRKGSALRVFAIFSFRFDHNLVPDLLANLDSIVDGWVAYDDRESESKYGNEAARHIQLVNRARELGADWVLAIDPDERLECRAELEIPVMTSVKRRIIWTFRLRELYTVDAYRVDGIWGQKIVARLFPLFDGQVFSDQWLHSPKYPIEPGYAVRQSDLNLYHLKMIAPERRVARRDLYMHLDPDNKYQSIGYSYLADEVGASLETIPPDRSYKPLHREDGGLWMMEAKRFDS
jgi:hypothetical protein